MVVDPAETRTHLINATGAGHEAGRAPGQKHGNIRFRRGSDLGHIELRAGSGGNRHVSGVCGIDPALLITQLMSSLIAKTGRQRPACRGAGRPRNTRGH